MDGGVSATRVPGGRASASGQGQFHGRGFLLSLRKTTLKGGGHVWKWQPGRGFDGEEPDSSPGEQGPDPRRPVGWRQMCFLYRAGACPPARLPTVVIRVAESRPLAPAPIHRSQRHW